MKVLIVSKYKWKSRDKKHEEIKKLMRMDVSFDTLQKDLKPEVKDGRITYEWYEKNISSLAKGKYTHAVFQFSKADRTKWKISSNLNGSNQRDGDGFGEAWVCCDENSTMTMDDGEKWNLYVKTVAHEIGHELTRSGYTKLEVHDYDYKRHLNNLRQFYIDIQKPSVLKFLQDQLAKLLEKKYLRPLTEWTVTQAYGVADSATYPLTGHHIGTDFRAGVGTPLFMPWDGEVTRTGFTASLGFWCEVKIEDWYMVCLHLQKLPTTGKKRRGDTFAHVGSTGFIKGVHAHLEGWTEQMDRAKLTKGNWRQKTFDITNKIK